MDQNRGPDLVVLIVVLTVISTIVVSLRLYTRLVVQRGIGWDDGAMGAGMVKITSIMRSPNVADHAVLGLCHHICSLKYYGCQVRIWSTL